MNCFEEIRDRLDIRTVVEHYGIEIKRNNTCLCPFHNDHNPSAHIYPNAFHCFACNVHYDALGFVMNLCDLSAIDAARKLNDDFNLGIGFGKQKNFRKTYNKEAEIREIRRKKRERFETWEKEAWQTVVDFRWLMRDWYEKYKPPIMDHVSDDYQLDKRFVYALQNYSLAYAFSLDWIQQFSNEDKVRYKYVVDNMREFLNEHKIEERAQNPQSPRTYFKFQTANSTNIDSDNQR